MLQVHVVCRCKQAKVGTSEKCFGLNENNTTALPWPSRSLHRKAHTADPRELGGKNGERALGPFVLI